MRIGGGAGKRTPEDAELSDFIDRDADSLLAKIDFAGIVGRFGRSTVLGIFTGASGIVLAIKENIVANGEAVAGAIQTVATGVSDAPGEVFVGATDVAAAELSQFGMFATPVGVLVVLSVITAAIFAIDLFLGGNE